MFDGVEIHSLHWDNFNPDMLEAHKSVMEKFGIPVRYHNRNIGHDLWLDEVARSSRAEIFGFIEPDLIPLNPEIVEKAIKFVRSTGTFIGTAQAANHIFPASHIYASPSFFFMSTDCYELLRRPSFLATLRTDSAENVSYEAERRGVRYRALYPTHWEREAQGGAWTLGNYGWFGVGTVFEGGIYHLFEGRRQQNVDLFVRRCSEVANGTFTTADFHSSTALEPPARFHPVSMPGGSAPRRALRKASEGLSHLASVPWRRR